MTIERSVDLSAESEIVTTPIPPIDVRMVGGETEREAGADYGTWFTITIPATTPQATVAQRILPLDRYRKSAEIIVFNGAGAAAGAFVLVGAKGQILNGLGGQLQAGRYPVENVQELWLTGDGTNSMIVTVLTERWAESGSK